MTSSHQLPSSLRILLLEVVHQGPPTVLTAWLQVYLLLLRVFPVQCEAVVLLGVTSPRILGLVNPRDASSSIVGGSSGGAGECVAGRTRFGAAPDPLPDVVVGGVRGRNRKISP